MSTQRFDLTVESRQTGKATSRALRVNGKVPATLYGATKPTNLSLSAKEIVKFNVRAYENALFNLKSAETGLNNTVVLIKDVDVHPVSRRPVHVDLYALDLKKAVRVFVEIQLEGKAIGLSEGGLLNVVNRQVEVECLPTDIPEKITADVTNLSVGDALHVSDLTAPKGVKFISAPELTIAVVNVDEEVSTTPQAAAAEAAPAAAPAAGAKPAAGAAAPAAAKAPAKK